MLLNPIQTRFLRGQAHQLKPVVMLGQNGLTDNVLAEVNRALDDHELIKVRINAEDRDERQKMIERISGHSGAVLVQRIGHIAVFFRRNEEKPRIALPA